MESPQTTQAITNPSRLLTLPAELRDQILAYILHNPSGFQLTRPVTERRTYVTWCKTHLYPLSAASKQLRRESFAVFASTNTFVTTANGLVLLLRHLGPAGRASLRHVHLTFAYGFMPNNNIRRALPLLGECGQLRLCVALYVENLRILYTTPYAEPRGQQQQQQQAVDPDAPATTQWSWVFPAHGKRSPFAGELRETMYRSAGELRELMGRATEIKWLDEQPSEALVEFMREAEQWLIAGNTQPR